MSETTNWIQAIAGAVGLLGIGWTVSSAVEAIKVNRKAVQQAVLSSDRATMPMLEFIWNRGPNGSVEINAPVQRRFFEVKNVGLGPALKISIHSTRGIGSVSIPVTSLGVGRSLFTSYDDFEIYEFGLTAEYESAHGRRYQCRLSSRGGSDIHQEYVTYPAPMDDVELLFAKNVVTAKEQS